VSCQHTECVGVLKTGVSSMVTALVLPLSIFQQYVWHYGQILNQLAVGMLGWPWRLHVRTDV
jgi:hypothetical protein